MRSSTSYLDLTVLPTDTIIVLGSTRFIMIWHLVVLLRTSTTLVLLITCWYLNWLRQDNNFQRQWRREIRAASTPTIFRILVTLAMIGSVQVYELVGIFRASIHEGRLVFRCRTRSPRKNHLVFKPSSQPQTIKHKVAGSLYRAKKRMRHSRLYKYLMMLWRAIGIRSKWFDELFTFRESVELVVQIFQVAQVSALNPSSATAIASVVMLVLNSFSSALVEHVFAVQGHEKLNTGVFIMKVRLALLVTDACLDFLFCIAIPFTIAVYYLRHIDYATMTFDRTYQDAWRAIMFRQQQQISFSTGADLASTVVLHFGLLYCLMKVQSIVDRSDAMLPVKKRSIVELASKSAIRLPCKIPLKSWMQTPQEFSYNHAVASRHPLVSAMLHMFPFLYAIVGIIVLSAFTFARVGVAHDVQGCKLYTYPWFSLQAACTVMEINCFRRQLAGTADEMDRVLHTVNMKWAHTLIFSHCPALVMPSTIRSIPRLFTIEIYNSTLVDWPESASPTSASNPGLTEFRFLSMNFTDGVLPAGLLTKDLTNALTDVFTARTNLKTLPENLHESWKEVISLCMEESALTDIPEGIRQMKTLSWVSLIGNQITTIRSGFLDELRLHFLLLSGNPMQSLPSSLPDSVLNESCSLALENSEVTKLPAWLQEFLEHIVDQPSSLFCQTSLHASQLCTNRVTRSLMQNMTNIKSINWLLSRCQADLYGQIRWAGFPVIVKNRVP